MKFCEAVSMTVMADFAFIIVHNVYRHAIVQLLSWQRGSCSPCLEYLIVLFVPSMVNIIEWLSV